MSSSHPLVARFAQAGLALELSDGPLVTRGVVGTQDIVQIDILRRSARRAKTEHFAIWPGHPDNRLEVENLDRRLEQLVLMVHEPRRRFEVELPRRGWVDPGVRVRQVGQRRFAERWTDNSKRHFLCGMDEQHLFIAQLPEPATTVRQAHEALKDPRVTLAERRAPSPTVRQGEWFFVALTAYQESVVHASLKRGGGAVIRKRMGIAQAAGLARLGRPHIADEVLVTRGEVDTGTGRRQPTIHVRGAVRHPDHRTVLFHHWRLVIPNRERMDQPVSGVSWVD